MSDLLRDIVGWVERVITEVGYPGLALAMFLETVFPPIPSEIILPFAGVLARRGELDPAGVVVAATVGSLAGAGALYAIGHWVEDHVLIGLVRRYGRWVGLTERGFLRALAAFERHGVAAVFFGRLLPGLRSIISLPAGMSRMRIAAFVLATVAGSAVWNALFGGLGWFFGEHWEAALTWIALYEEVVLVGLGVALAAYGGWWLFRRGRGAGAPPTAA